MPAPWAILLVATPILAAAYQLLPTVGEWRTIAFPMYGFAMSIVITVAVLRRTRERRAAWLAIAMAFTLLTVGDVSYTVLALIGPEVPYPSVADVFYLAGYLALVIGAIALVRGRTTGSERTSVIDAAIVTMGAAAAFWTTIMLPSISGASDPLAITVSLSYPAVDLLLLMVGLRTVLGGGAKPRFLQFLMAGLALYFVADVIYATAILDGTYVFGDPVDMGWIVGVLLVGCAVLHPSAMQPVVRVAKAESRLSAPRLALLAVAAFLAPALLLVVGDTGDPFVQAGLVLSWTVLFGLVLVRMALSVDELGTSLIQRRRLQDDLAYQATHDSLTRLANRALFESRLESAVVPDPTGTGLIFLDLDDFKTVNDTLGHATGDALLKTIAARLQREVRSTDLAARLGGDEFAILVEHCPRCAPSRSASSWQSAPRSPWLAGISSSTPARASHSAGKAWPALT
jgi:GGDEF domain-containing protein